MLPILDNHPSYDAFTKAVIRLIIASVDINIV